MRRVFVSLALLLALNTVCRAAPVAQTRPWRIAIAGGQAVAARGGDIPGYLSLLALQGLPRVRIDEGELTDPKRLRQFDVVIACWGSFGSEPAMRALEQFAREGGIVVSDGWPPPSPEVIPGKRLGPASTPNIRFVASDSPISRGLPELGVIKSAARHRQAGAIIPDAGSGAIVLARYTDEDTPENLRGQFPDGNQGAPAILLIPCGKGHILYCGPSFPPSAPDPTRPVDHLIYRVLELLSGGELRGRLCTTRVDRAEFVSQRPPAEETVAYPAPSGPAQPVPEGFEVLEEAARLQDFCMTGTLPADGSARVLVGHWSNRDTSEVAFASGKLTVRHVRGGQAQPPYVAPLSRPGAEIMVTRRAGLMTVAVDGAVVYSGCPGPPQQGVLAVAGLQDAFCQPLAPVHFADDFMREDESTGEWEALSGAWQVVTSEGKAETGVNPFDYQATANPEAVSLTGYWFWSDVACSVSTQGAGHAVGLIADCAGDDDYVLLKLVFGAEPRASRLQLVQRRPGRALLLAEASVSAARSDWHRLELRSSRGRLQGWLNGQLAVQAQGSAAACGRVGLWCENGSARFDDVSVEPWVASAPGQTPRLEETLLAGGTWERDGAEGPLNAEGPSGARLLLPWPPVEDCSASVKVKVGQAEAAGLLLRAQGSAGVLAVLRRDEGKLRLKVYRQGNPGTVLADLPVPGSPAAWHVLGARYAGMRLAVSVDGELQAEVLDGASEGGTVGLYARGKQRAQFEQFEAWAEPADDHLADKMTPDFAGVIDRNTWAGRSGAWTPDPARLDRLWHAGYFPGPVRVEAGIHPRGAPETTTRLHLSQPGQPQGGYTLQANRTWAEHTVDLELAYAGKVVARGVAQVAAGRPYALGLQRCNGDLCATVDGEGVLAWRDSQARPELCSLGLDNGGQLLVADDVAVSSPQVRDCTFETAPTDWTVESGTWKVSSRWSCAPDWAWFCGENPDGPAMVATRQSYTGDMDVVAYFGAKMIKLSGKMVEKLADVHLGCCASEEKADSGYHFVVGSDDNRRTVLLRNGQEVASSPYRIAQGLIHNDWLRLTIRRRGGEIALWVWDSPVLVWTDPQPLPGGRVALGTRANGIVVPRVTIYGQPIESAAPPPALMAPVELAWTTRSQLPLLTFTQDQPTAEFGGDWGLWPQQTDCRGTATFMAGQDAEGQAGGAMKVDYTIKAAPRSFSLWLTSGDSAVDLTTYDRLVLYARGNVPSLTVVVKDTSATDPDQPTGIAEYVLEGLTDQWRRFEVPFAAFRPRQAGGRLDWRAINHFGIAMIAPQNAESGTFWVDNLRAEAGGAD